MPRKILFTVLTNYVEYDRDHNQFDPTEDICYFGSSGLGSGRNHRSKDIDSCEETMRRIACCGRRLW